MINYINLLFLMFLVSCTETKKPEFNIIDEAKSIILDWSNTTEMTDKEFDKLPAKKETEDQGHLHENCFAYWCNEDETARGQFRSNLGGFNYISIF